jgi:hypothetical protein
MKTIKGLENQRWFIWTIVAIVVILGGLATYITYVSDLDSPNVSAIILTHVKKKTLVLNPTMPEATTSTTSLFYYSMYAQSDSGLSSCSGIAYVQQGYKNIDLTAASEYYTDVTATNPVSFISWTVKNIKCSGAYLDDDWLYSDELHLGYSGVGVTKDELKNLTFSPRVIYQLGSQFWVFDSNIDEEDNLPGNSLCQASASFDNSDKLNKYNLSCQWEFNDPENIIADPGGDIGGTGNYYFTSIK